ncbi:hypothetical protein [Fulvimarina sp. MAC8]|uniref:hypothetical protein n=1 Tax=Fulvimarina sp. MAC8 TaxID=3162874 RepID=UPI0032EEFE43
MIGTVDSRQVDGVDADMRTAIKIALDELPPELSARIAMKRPKIGRQDYDEARRLIAEHLVVRVREIVECRRREHAADRVHG